MLSSISALKRAPLCSRLNTISQLRCASRLSAVKRGLQGETQDEPRRSFPPRSRSSGRTDFSNDRKSFDRGLSRRSDDLGSERKSHGRTSFRSDDTSSSRAKSFDRPSFRDIDGRKNRKSFTETDPGRQRSDVKRDDTPYRREKSENRRDDNSYRRERLIQGPSFRREDGKRDRPFDKSAFGNRDEPNQNRKPYDRTAFRRNDGPDQDKTPHDRSTFRRNDGPGQDKKSYDRAASDDGARTTPTRNEYISIPYTTAASEFLYGLNVVFAALKSRRRSLYTLYIHKRARDNVYKGADLEQLATGAGVKVRRVDNDFLPVMDKMTDNRPHNGVILEVSPLPMPPVEQLGKVQPDRQSPLLLSQTQTAEERALYGISQFLPAPTEPWRQPFVLMLDGILDPGNMGNILRTAYFYGVDAVAVCVNTCAPLTSSILHKAASGATEALQILAIQRPADFVATSSRNGWRVHAAVAPEASGNNYKSTTRPQFSTNKMVSPLARAPSILMMGAEGEGLRLNLKNKASYNVLIAGQQRRAKDDMGVDSLNVGAAAAVLIEAFMRAPVETRERRMERMERAEDVEKGQITEFGEKAEANEVAEKDDVKEAADKLEKLF